MEFMELSIYHHPEESYSRQLDRRVAMQERPYGYNMSPPPADTQDFNQKRLESSKEYSPKKGRAV